MSDITELERRITTALERIGTGVEGVTAASGAEDALAKVEALTQELEAEKMANSQLEERVNAIKDKQDTTIKKLEGQVENLSTILAKHEDDAKRLRQVNEVLRNSNVALRDANENGVGDPELINGSMQAELDGLRATQAADLGELEAIIDEIKPLVEEGA